MTQKSWTAAEIYVNHEPQKRDLSWVENIIRDPKQITYEQLLEMFWSSDSGSRAKMCSAGVPAVSAWPGGRVTLATVLPAVSGTVSAKMLPVVE